MRFKLKNTVLAEIHRLNYFAYSDKAQRESAPTSSSDNRSDPSRHIEAHLNASFFQGLVHGARYIVAIPRYCENKARKAGEQR